MFKKSNQTLLQELAESEGMSVDELLEQATFDSVSPGICPCGYTIEVEPDCREGYCDVCKMGTVKSALVLAGMI